MPTAKDAPYKQRQRLRATHRRLATSEELREYQLANGVSVLSVARTVRRTLAKSPSP